MSNAHPTPPPLEESARLAARVAALEREVQDLRQREANLLNRALRESEERLSLALEGGDLATWDWNVVTGRVVFSERWAALLGYASEEIEPHLRSWEKLLHPEDLPRVLELLNRHLQSQTPAYASEHRLRHKSGHWVWVLDKGKVIERDAVGRPLRACGTDQDITERKRAEEQLRASEERFRLLAESSLTGIYLFQDDRFRYVNQALAALFGYGVKELIDRLGPLDLTHPDDRSRVAEYVRRRVSGEVEAVHYEFRGRRKDGTTIRVEAHGRRIEYEGQMGVIGTLRDITERKQAEDALRESEERYRMLVEESPDAIGIYQEGELVFVNSTGARQLGAQTKAELLGRKSEQIIHPDDLEAAMSRIRRRIAGETGMYPAEVRYLRLDGTIVPVEVSATPILFGGKPAVQFIARDITERKQVEAALRESEDRYRLLVEESPDGIGIFQEGKLVFVNSTGTQQSGAKTKDEILGRTIEQIVHPDDHAAALDRVRRRLAGETGLYPAEVRYLRLDGTVVPMELGATPILYRGKPALQFIVRDITERKRAEERISEQAALLDAATDAIYVRTLDHAVTYWNNGAERLYGWSRAEALGRKITELGNADPEAFEAAHAALLAQGSWSGELKKTSKTGKERVVFCRWTLLRNEQGQPREILAINTDITETRKWETQFLRAQRLEAIGALAGGLAHDLNNILAPILMAAPLLRETATDPESRAMLVTMETCARRGADIIKQLLTFARGKPGARVPLPLRHLLLEMEKIIRETFPRNIQPRVNTAKDLWLVLGDATQVHQALLNLCVNARDAMPDGGTLTLAPENVTVDEAFAAVAPDAKPGAYVRLSVTDTGTGIPPEHLDRIFDPFFTTKAIGTGTGLGLATVLGIVRGHGGFVRVNSLLGHGTTFDLYLPASREANPASLGDQAPPPPPRGQRELILVVDDEVGVRKVIQRALKKQGYRVLIAGEGREALALFTRHRTEIRAILTDMMMPGMDGPSLIRAVQKLEPRLPVIGMTGLAERAGIKGLESLDLSVLLTKPFVGGELLTALYEALAKPQSAPAEKS